MPYKHIDVIRAEHALRAPAIRARLADFAAVPPGRWFYELAYCLLTPQSSARNAAQAIETLMAQQYFERGMDPTPVLRDPANYIRFHNTKARRLSEARQAFPLLQARLLEGGQHAEARVTNGPSMRDWLVTNIRGLGWKEASHFLRNIGFRDLAILDRHILKNLRRHGAIRSIPASLTPQRYRAIEQAFRRFAAHAAIPLDELDLLFWSRETGEIRK